MWVKQDGHTMTDSGNISISQVDCGGNTDLVNEVAANAAFTNQDYQTAASLYKNLLSEEKRKVNPDRHEYSRTIYCICLIHTDKKDEALAQLDIVLKHLANVKSAFNQPQNDALYNCIYTFWLLGDLEFAIEKLKELVAKFETNPKTYMDQLVETNSALGKCYRATQNFQAAEAAFRQNLELSVGNLTREYNARMTMSQFYQVMGRKDEALAQLNTMLTKIEKRKSGSFQLGELYWELCQFHTSYYDFSSARKYLDKANPILNKANYKKEREEEFASFIRDQAALLFTEGKYKKAEQLLKDLVKQTHNEECIAESNLSLIDHYLTLGSVGKAKAMIDCHLDLTKIIDDSDNSRLTVPHYLIHSGEFEQALKMIANIQKRKDLSQMTVHGMYAQFLKAMALRVKNDYEKAKVEFEELLKMESLLYGGTSIPGASVKCNLAEIHLCLGNKEKALELGKEAIEFLNEFCHHEFHEFLECRTDYARILLSVGEYEDAETELNIVLKHQLNNFDDDSVFLASTYHCIGNLHFKRKDLDKAEMYFQKAIDIRHKQHGESHPKTVASLSSMGALKTALGKYEEAEMLLRKTYEERKKSLPPEHKLVVSSEKNLARLLKILGREDEVNELVSQKP